MRSCGCPGDIRRRAAVTCGPRWALADGLAAGWTAYGPGLLRRGAWGSSGRRAMTYQGARGGCCPSGPAPFPARNGYAWAPQWPPAGCPTVALAAYGPGTLRRGAWDRGRRGTIEIRRSPSLHRENRGCAGPTFDAGGVYCQAERYRLERDNNRSSPTLSAPVRLTLEDNKVRRSARKGEARHAKGTRSKHAAGVWRASRRAKCDIVAKKEIGAAKRESASAPARPVSCSPPGAQRPSGAPPARVGVVEAGGLEARPRLRASSEGGSERGEMRGAWWMGVRSPHSTPRPAPLTNWRRLRWSKLFTLNSGMSNSR